MAESGASVTARVEGIEQAIKKLYELDRKARRRVANAGVRAGLRVALKAARAEVPVQTGGLRKSLRITSVRLDQITGTVSGSVAAGASSRAMKKKGLTAYYALMVHQGTRARQDIKPKKAKAMTVGDGFAKHVRMHPGTRPNPFLERAASSAFQAAIAAFSAEFARKLEAEVGK